jgi:hypothetical protein
MACEVLFQEVKRTCRDKIDAGAKHVRQLPNGRTQPYSRSSSVKQQARFYFLFLCVVRSYVIASSRLCVGCCMQFLVPREPQITCAVVVGALY